MKKVYFLIAAVSLIFSSCGLFTDYFFYYPVDPVVHEKLPEYVPDVVWSYETDILSGNTSATSYTLQDGQYLYFLDFTDRSDSPHWCISKLDLDAVQKVWSSDPILYHCLSVPVKCGKYIFIEDGNSTAKEIYCFSDEDGKLLATISLGSTDDERIINSIVCNTLHAVSDRYLVWSNGTSMKEKYANEDFGILKIDVSDIDFSIDPEESQVPPIEVLLKLEIPKSIITHFISEDGIVYFQTYHPTDNDPPCVFGAVDVETGELKWKNEETGMSGRGEESLYIVHDSENGIEDKLFSFENDAGCYNLADGSIVWQKIQTEEELMTEPYIGGLIYNVGITYNDGFFYYTTIESKYSYINKPDSLKTNIKCTDAKTGELVWGYLPEGSGSLQTRPIVANGKVFVLTDTAGLLVLDAKTGEVIGADESVCISVMERNALWNGNVIYFDFSSEYAKIYCIKP